MLAGAAISSQSALSQLVPTPLPRPAPTPVKPPSLTVIQGKVTNIQGNTVTVKTPDIRPVCKLSVPCPLYIIAGVTFNVDISKAVFQSANGTPASNNLRVGDLIIVAGQQGPILSTTILSPVPVIRTLKAKVVEKDAQS